MAGVGAWAERLALRPPLLPMTARSVAELPNSGRWAYEPKFDGWRCLAFRQPGGRVVLQSRQQRSLTRYFPEVVTALQEQLSGGVVLDGELVVCCAGRLDFAALHHRLASGRCLAAAPPACLVVFDVLADGIDDLRGLPYAERRDLVAELLAGVMPPLALMPMTTSEPGAQTWLTDHALAGIEGVVAKHVGHPYRPARRAWQRCAPELQQKRS